MYPHILLLSNIYIYESAILNLNFGTRHPGSKSLSYYSLIMSLRTNTKPFQLSLLFKRINSIVFMIMHGTYVKNLLQGWPSNSFQNVGTNLHKYMTYA